MRELSAIANLASRISRRIGPMAWVWITVIAAVLLSTSMIWIEEVQNGLFAHFMDEQALLRQASVDLSKGYLHISLAGPPQSPFDRAQGLALLDQSVSTLERALRRQQEFEAGGAATALTDKATRSQLAAFAQALEAFRVLLAKKREVPESTLREVELRISFFALERQAAALDSQLQQDLSEVMRRYDLLQMEIILGSGVLLIVISAAVYAGGRARKQTEKTLSQSEARLRTLFQTIPDLVWLKDTAGFYLDCNAMFEQLYGAVKSDIIGKTDYDFVDRELADFFREHDRKAMAAGMPCSNEEWLTFAVDGHRALFDTMKTPLLDASGKTLGVLGIARDITERKRAEAALIKSEDKFRKSFYTSPDSVNINRLDDGMYISINPGFTKIMGYTEEDIIGRTSFDYHIWQNIEDRQRLVAGLKKDGQVANLEAAFRSKSGDIVYGLMSSSVIDLNGIPHILSITRDITERKRAEEEREKLQAQLNQAKKMEAIGSLAGGIAHDLNNILFPISGLSEMLLDEIPPDDPSYDNIEQIHKSAKRGSDLVKQILAFSRQSNLQKLPIRIQPILKETLNLVRAAIPMNIEISNTVDPDCGMVSANPTQVHQIMMNLITNAYHAVEQTGGSIHVELKETAFGKDESPFHTVQPGKYASISVSDTGIGMDQLLIDKIFTPYFTTKEHGKGTGLGLSVVHGIVKDHGGDICVDSEIGKGTTFIVYLPLIGNTAESKTVVDTRKDLMGSESILLVDDEAPIALMVKMMLERLGYQVTVRLSSLDALDAFRADPSKYDLVISDRSMPNMTGEQLSSEMISIRPGIPIIICTGLSDDNNQQRGKAMGIKGFLMKPVSLDDLARMVRNVLDETANVKTMADHHDLLNNPAA